VQDDIINLLTWLFAKLVRLTWWLTVRGTRVAAQQTAGVLPGATNRGGALGLALLGGGVWWLILVVIGSIVWGGGGFKFFGVVGAGVAACIAYALFKRQLALVHTAEGGISVGEAKGRLGVATPHVIDRKSRVRHVSVFGATGSGKSTALKNLVSQDFVAPERPGVMVVDIKDDLVLDIATRVPEHRLNDVLLFDPADTAFPPAFNPFADVPEESRTLAAAELIAALKRLYADSWGPRLEHVLRHVVLTLLETPDATLLDIARLLTDPDYRAWALPHVDNLAVQDFWQREFPGIVGTKGSLANVESLLNKLSIFAYPEIRNVVGQTRRGINFRRAMDQGKILLFNLPQGKLGEDASSFLASLVIGKAQLAAQSRVNVPHQFRKPFYLFADEFQNYQTGAFDKLVTEGRSMGIGLVAACQFPEQLPQPLRLSLQKNCAYALYCSQENGKHHIKVEKQQEPDADDAVTKLVATAPKRVADDGRVGQIRVVSRFTLARPRASVEAEITRRLRTQATVDASFNTARDDTEAVLPPLNGFGSVKRVIRNTDEW
jgi:hypothetical protein